jgi:Spy/CpxP family protein refolding chaperone
MHDILDQDQRNTLVSTLRDTIAKHQAAVDPRAEMDAFAKTLKLTDDQKQKIGAIMQQSGSDISNVRKSEESVLDAFPSADFSLDKLIPAGSAKDRTQHSLDNIVDIAGRMAATLTPQQRTMLAKGMSGESPAQTRQSLTDDDTSVQPSEPTDSTSESLVWGGARAVGWGRGIGWGGYRGYGWRGGFASPFYRGFGWGRPWVW